MDEIDLNIWHDSINGTKLNNILKISLLKPWNVDYYLAIKYRDETCWSTVLSILRLLNADRWIVVKRRHVKFLVGRHTVWQALDSCHKNFRWFQYYSLVIFWFNQLPNILPVIFEILRKMSRKINDICKDTSTVTVP